MRFETFTEEEGWVLNNFMGTNQSVLESGGQIILRSLIQPKNITKIKVTIDSYVTNQSGVNYTQELYRQLHESYTQESNENNNAMTKDISELIPNAQ